MADKFTVSNPEANAPIDTIVEGQRYEIVGGDTVEATNEAHAQYLKETYPFLQVEGPSGPILSSAEIAAANASDEDTALGDGKPDSGKDVKKAADKAKAKSTAKKTAAKKAPAKKKAKK